uniref:HTH myb-type domain-containing protein n=1 Tax=Calcidiscus leptoporus TaxID=127549 RepID=A0A7S0J772_9EUKA|mmetsp:Transcript_41277/g.96476  ORF Transcript_41277/g.96476 Transcript_41277/m.96476 type:complete len:553 (+) Transcript_41277:147-1805(+)
MSGAADASEAAHAREGSGASHAGKRARSWDVDVSLEELVSWDVLEQFMQDIPSEPAGIEQSPLEAIDGRDLSPSADTALMLRGPAEASSCAASNLSSAAAFPGAWPPAQGCVGIGSVAPSAVASNLGSGASCGSTAASLQSICSCWQQHSSPSTPLHANALVPMWGAEFLPSVLGGPDEDRAADSAVPPDLDSPSSAHLADRQVHKQRFVWTADLHQRFEVAVNSLGIDHAKPQAISQLMNCEGEGAPTRQNIKSHLQKYRLLMQKRARQSSNPGDEAVPASEGASAGSTASAAASAATTTGSTSAAPATSTAIVISGGASGASWPASITPSDMLSGGSTPSKSATAASESEGAPLPAQHQTFMLPSEQNELELNLEQHLERQELNLKVQMELQTKLHRQLLVQRQLQHQLEHSFNSGETAEGLETQRRSAAAALKNSLRERLTKHVAMQQEMLQHLDALVSSEVSKPAAQISNADQSRAAAMIRAVTGVVRVGAANEAAAALPAGDGERLRADVAAAAESLQAADSADSGADSSEGSATAALFVKSEVSAL